MMNTTANTLGTVHVNTRVACTDASCRKHGATHTHHAVKVKEVVTVREFLTRNDLLGRVDDVSEYALDNVHVIHEEAEASGNTYCAGKVRWSLQGAFRNSVGQWEPAAWGYVVSERPDCSLVWVQPC